MAQNLRRQGILADVFERDRSPWDRPQGYRLHLDADGINALHDSLTPDLFRLFDETSMKAAAFTTIVDTQLAIRMRRSHDQHGGTHAQPHDGLPAHVNVNRATLRELLLSGLGKQVHFGSKLTSVAEHADGVILHFDDGSRVDADILVGADGIRSPVRTWRAPQLQTRDSGVRAIYGRIPLPAALSCVPEHAQRDVFTVAVDERQAFFGLGPVVFPRRPELAAAPVSSARLSPQEDYIVAIVGGRQALFGVDEAALRGMSSSSLRDLATSVLASWPAATRLILERCDVSSFFAVEMYTSVPGVLPRPTRSTLLGDAIHAMTPTLGRGANLALRDAALLGHHLSAVLAGTIDIAHALAAYESEMVPYGFEVVREAAAMGVRLMGQTQLP